jgi:hypothetical protein
LSIKPFIQIKAHLVLPDKKVFLELKDRLGLKEKKETMAHPVNQALPENLDFRVFIKIYEYIL